MLSKVLIQHERNSWLYTNCFCCAPVQFCKRMTSSYITIIQEYQCSLTDNNIFLPVTLSATCINVSWAWHTVSSKSVLSEWLYWLFEVCTKWFQCMPSRCIRPPGVHIFLPNHHQRADASNCLNNCCCLNEEGGLATLYRSLLAEWVSNNVYSVQPWRSYSSPHWNHGGGSGQNSLFTIV